MNREKDSERGRALFGGRLVGQLPVPRRWKWLAPPLSNLASDSPVGGYFTLREAPNCHSPLFPILAPIFLIFYLEVDSKHWNGIIRYAYLKVALLVNSKYFWTFQDSHVWLQKIIKGCTLWNVPKKSILQIGSLLDTHKVRTPIPLGYNGFYTMYYNDIGEFQILYLQDICWQHWCLSTSDFHYSIAVSIIQ
jgi:hypothetical protein